MKKLFFVLLSMSSMAFCMDSKEQKSASSSASSCSSSTVCACSSSAVSSSAAASTSAPAVQRKYNCDDLTRRAVVELAAYKDQFDRKKTTLMSNLAAAFLPADLRNHEANVQTIRNDAYRTYQDLNANPYCSDSLKAQFLKLAKKIDEFLRTRPYVPQAAPRLF